MTSEMTRSFASSGGLETTAARRARKRKETRAT
jgi:hypothetical protein